MVPEENFFVPVWAFSLGVHGFSGKEDWKILSSVL